MKGRNLLRKAAISVSLAAAVASAKADSLELINGDHYQGTVVSVTQSNVLFQSDILGSVFLPRNKVAQINFGTASPSVAKNVTNSVSSNAPVVGPSLILQGPQSTASAPGAVAQNDAVLDQMRRQGLDPNLVNAVQQQVFGQGNPAAAQKFNELMGGLMSGKLSVTDIRAQAQESIQQIKDAKRQLGPEIGDSFDGYLTILQDFVNETATNTTITASPPNVSNPAATPANAAP